jgi:hypothetical protein
MKQSKVINESIAKREPYTSFDEGTYYTMGTFKQFCKDRDYKRVAIFGYYKSKYNWTVDEAEQMYNNAPDGWTDGTGVYRLYDWGKGENRVVNDRHDQDWHIPELDHIISRDEAKKLGWANKKINSPNNMQVLPRILNRMLSNIKDEEAPAIIPLLMAQFPNVKLEK